MRSKIDLSQCEIVRPFYPGGDYKNYIYKDNSVVVDNPPFSILAEICRFYLERGIKFFLFAPQLTVFSSSFTQKWTSIITDSSIIYENGANVKTAFRTNLFPDVEVWGCPELARAIDIAQHVRDKPALPKYDYPDEVLTVSKVAQVTRRGVDLFVKRGCAMRISALDNQKKVGKACFGGAFLLSDECKEEICRAQKLAGVPKIFSDDAIAWSLSEREKKLIASMKE